VPTLDSIKDIRLYQNKNGYRFSVDALLLFSFIKLQRVQRIADIGAGSGIIGILLAKKYLGAHVVLIEMQKSLAALAEENIAANSLNERVAVIRCDARKISRCPEHLPPHSFDLVVSNPPFRKVKTGRLSASDERSIARHEIKLTLKDLVGSAALLLKHHGRFSVIHLPERLPELIGILRTCSLEPKRLRFVHSTGSSEAKMVLVEAVMGARTGLKTDPPLFIYKDNGSYTDEMQAIYA
jgi:tRNA1Val (adenine37-N6)-methyltransferase